MEENSYEGPALWADSARSAPIVSGRQEDGINGGSVSVR